MFTVNKLVNVSDVENVRNGGRFNVTEHDEFGRGWRRYLWAPNRSWVVNGPLSSLESGGKAQHGCQSPEKR